MRWKIAKVDAFDCLRLDWTHIPIARHPHWPHRSYDPLPREVVRTFAVETVRAFVAKGRALRPEGYVPPSELLEID